MRETQILRGLHKARAQMGRNYADGYAPDELGLRRGVAKLKGPGTTTSDSIPANLSRGEAVLPAKTVQKVGAGNIARLIEQTNGKPPARGLRAGGRHAVGVIPGMEVTESFDELKVPTRDEGIAKMKARPAPPMGNTTTAGAAPVQEPAGPQTLKQRATGLFSMGKSGIAGIADSASSTVKPAALGVKGVGMGLLGGYYGNAAAEASRTIGKPTVAAAPYADDPRTAAIPTDGYSPAPQKQAYNYFTDNEVGRNVGNTMNAAAMIPGVGPVARSALGMGTGAISRTARAAGNPLVAGALQGASANVRDGRDQTAQSAASTVEPFNPNQTAATQARTNFTPGNAGAGRGNLTPPGTPGGVTDPRSRDFSAELNALPVNLPSDLRQGVIHKTVDARGRTTYSGMNVGAGADGQTPIVDGLGKSLQPRGGLHYAAAGAPVAMGAGGFAITPSGGAAQPAQGKPQTAQPSGLSAGQTGALGNPAVSQALAAAAARGDMDAVRGFYQRDGGTFNGRTAQQDAPQATAGVAGFNGSGSQWEREKDAWNNKVDYSGLMKGSPRRVQALLLAQQKMAQDRELGMADVSARREGNYLQSDTSLKTAAMQRDASMHGHEVSRDNSLRSNQVTREGNELQFAGTQNRLGLDRAKLSYEMTQSAAKGVNDDNLNSVHATEVDPKTGLKVKSQPKADELGQALRAAAGRMKTPDGEPVSLEQLRATNPARYQSMRTAIEGQIGMGQAIDQYAAGNTFGQKGGWAPPNITNVREMGPSDFPKGASLTDALLAPFKPGYRSQGVEIDVGGRKQVVPLSELFAGEHGGQYRQLVNEWLKANKRPILGDMNTGE